MSGSEPGPLPVSQGPGQNSFTAFTNRRGLSSSGTDLSLSECHRERMLREKNRKQTSARVFAQPNRSSISELGGVQEGGSPSPCDVWGPLPGFSPLVTVQRLVNGDRWWRGPFAFVSHARARHLGAGGFSVPLGGGMKGKCSTENALAWL